MTGVCEASPSLSPRPSLVANHCRHRGDSGSFLGLGTPPPGPSEPLTSLDRSPSSTATQRPVCGWGAGQRPAAFFLLTLDCPGPGRQALGVGTAARGQRRVPAGPGWGRGSHRSSCSLAHWWGVPSRALQTRAQSSWPFCHPGSEGGPGGCVQGQVLTREQAQTFQRRQTQANASWLCLESH